MDKKIVLADTGVLIKLYHGHKQIAKILDEIGYEGLVVSAITVAEIYQGMKNQEKKETLALLKKFNTIHFDTKISFRFIGLKLRFKDRLSIPDAIIAATSLVYKLPLFTFNVKDFGYIPGLIIYKLR